MKDSDRSRLALAVQPPDCLDIIGVRPLLVLRARLAQISKRRKERTKKIKQSASVRLSPTAPTFEKTRHRQSTSSWNLRTTAILALNDIEPLMFTASTLKQRKTCGERRH